MSKRAKPPAGNSNPQVEEWFSRFEHPLKDAMLLVRQSVLEADQRISETIKWSAPTFAFNGNLASFQPKARQFVSLMFHRGSEIPGIHPGLEGDSPLVRIMRFRNEAEVHERRPELQALVRAWCDWKAGERKPSA
jgi:hypothetical protein